MSRTEKKKNQGKTKEVKVIQSGYVKNWRNLGSGQLRTQQQSGTGGKISEK